MSASKETSGIFMHDTPNQIKNKINKYAVSGGQETLEEQRKYGGNPDVDVSFQYLTFFVDDDAEIQQLADVCIPLRALLTTGLPCRSSADW